MAAQLKWSSTRFRPATPNRSRSAGSSATCVDRIGQAPRERSRIDRIERPRSELEIDEQAGLARNDHLGDAADRRRDHGGLARHRLEVDDPERLVHRRAAEDRRVRVELDHIGARQHLLDPDDVAGRCADLGDPLGHLLADLGRVGRAGAEHDLQRRIDRRDGVDEVDDALSGG